MGYHLQAFICRQSDADLLPSRFNKAVKVLLPQSICLIPMTGEVFDEINDFTASPKILNNMFLTEWVEQRALQVMGNIQFAYIEAEYCGGQGGQTGIIWSNGERAQMIPFGPNAINTVLEYLGVVPDKNFDAFDTIGLGKYRRIEDWLDNID